MQSDVFNLLPDSPFRPPDWRWRHAQGVAASGRRISRNRDDPESIAAIRYLRMLPGCRTDCDRARLAAQWPAHHAAHQLAESDGPLVWEVQAVQARLLADQTDEEIAARCGPSAEAVHWYEALFFHVRDRLRARDWVMAHAIGGDLWHGFAGQPLGALWRYAAYSAGPHALDVVIAVTTGQPLPAWLRASFRGSPAYEEARFRLRARLALAALAARSVEELAPLAAVRERMLRLDRQSTGGRDEPPGLLSVMQDFLRSLARHRQAVPAQRRPGKGSRTKAPDRGAAEVPRLAELVTLLQQ